MELEDPVTPAVRAGLSTLGHEIRLWGVFSPEAIGSGQALVREAGAGVSYDASDPRKNGEAVPEPPWRPPGH